MDSNARPGSGLRARAHPLAQARARDLRSRALDRIRHARLQPLHHSIRCNQQGSGLPVHRCTRRPEEAIREGALELLRPRVTAVARGVVRNADGAEEVVQKAPPARLRSPGRRRAASRSGRRRRTKSTWRLTQTGSRSHRFTWGAAEARVSRRCFDHFHAELSVEIGKLVPRYALWLRMQEVGIQPTDLSPRQTLCFIEADLDAFLATEGLDLAERARTRLSRRMRRFDPRRPTPYETMQRLFSSADGPKPRPRA